MIKPGDIYASTFQSDKHYIRILGRYQDEIFIDHWWEELNKSMPGYDVNGPGQQEKEWTISWPTIKKEQLEQDFLAIDFSNLDLLIRFGVNSFNRQFEEGKNIASGIEKAKQSYNKEKDRDFEDLLNKLSHLEISYESAYLFIHIHTKFDILEVSKELKSVFEGI